MIYQRWKHQSCGFIAVCYTHITSDRLDLIEGKTPSTPSTSRCIIHWREIQWIYNVDSQNPLCGDLCRQICSHDFLKEFLTGRSALQVHYLFLDWQRGKAEVEGSDINHSSRIPRGCHQPAHCNLIKMGTGEWCVWTGECERCEWVWGVKVLGLYFHKLYLCPVFTKITWGGQMTGL